MEYATLLIAIVIAIAFWGTLIKTGKRAETIIDNTLGAVATASSVLPVKAQQLVDEAEHEADQKRSELKSRRAAWETKQAKL